MPIEKNIRYIENPAVAGEPERYHAVTVRVEPVLTSWRHSLFSYEWLRPDGSIKETTELSEGEKPKREAVEELLKSGQPIVKPVLGIGMMDNVEIGSGRAEFLTLAAQGVKEIPVHIQRSCESDFKDFIADVESFA